ncbi:MAG: response regulator [Nitrospirae bacterium]|nr:response regulator [Nitrospirota bacterium]
MKRIMIVDDDSLIRWGLSKQIPELCDFPIEIKSIDNGTDAAHEISSNFYDVCFLDVNLPDTNGIKVMQKIKEVSPKTEVIIMTAEELDDECKIKVEEMAYQFISKPFDLYQVKFILKHALERNGSSGVSMNMEKRRGKRRHERRPFRGTFDYSIKASELEEAKILNLKGNMVDISDGGMGVMTDYSLHAGQMIEIEGMDQKAGIVKWISMIDSNAFRAGIEFV